MKDLKNTDVRACDFKSYTFNKLIQKYFVNDKINFSIIIYTNIDIILYYF